MSQSDSGTDSPGWVRVDGAEKVVEKVVDSEIRSRKIELEVQEDEEADTNAKEAREALGISPGSMSGMINGYLTKAPAKKQGGRSVTVLTEVVQAIGSLCQQSRVEVCDWRQLWRAAALGLASAW